MTTGQTGGGLLLALWLAAGPTSSAIGPIGDVHAPPRSALGSADTLESAQLVALLYLRRLGEADSVRAELYPVVLLTDDGFEEARVFGREASGPAEEPPPAEEATTALDSIRRFTVYDDARPIGAFRVRDQDVVEYACTPVRVGRGELSLDPAGDPFDPENPRRDVYWTGEGGYGLAYFVAFARPIDQPGFGRDSLDDPEAAERLRAQIRAVAGDSLRALTLDHLPGPELSRTEPVLTGFELVDLDRDGRWEATGRVSVEIEHDTAPPDAGERFVDTFELAFVVWVADRGPGSKPGILLAQRGVLRGGAWGEGLELVEVMDLDGDGTADPFYELSGWEANQYVIYRLIEGRLESAFRGSGYGC